MALASYGRPRFLDELRRAVYATGDGGFRTEPVDWQSLVKRRAAGRGVDPGPRRPRRQRAARGWRRCCSSSPRWLHERDRRPAR